MKRQSSKTWISLVIALLLMLNFTSIRAYAAPDVLDIKGEAALLVDGTSGKILYEKNPDAPLHPASMTKMMTEYLVLEAIKNGKITWEQQTSISEYAYKISQNRDLSNVPLRSDFQYTVKELYESMAIYSANGSTIALAELVGGSETNFVKMMNDKAAEFGMKDYKFVNCTGLNNMDLIGKQPAGTGADEENIMSARATATLAYRLLHDYPEVLQTSSIPKKIFREGTDDQIKMDNWNWMLPNLVFAYEGVDGLKTGSTDLGGYSFTSTAKKNNMRLISVVMKTDSYNARFAETKKLLDYGFGNFTSKELYPAGYKIETQPEITVVKGKQKKVAVASKNPLVVVMKNGEENQYEPKYELNSSLATPEGALTAPIEKDQSVGYLTVNYKGSENLGYLAGSSGDKVEITALAPVKKAGWLTMFFRGIGEFISKIIKK